MSRGGKEEKELSPEVQKEIQLVVQRNKLVEWKSFGNQLLDVVKSHPEGSLLWLNDFPDEIKEEHLVHLLNVVRSLVK